MSDDLASWLLEQIAEDERVARSATPGPWIWEEREGSELVSASEDEYVDDPEMVGYGKAVVRATGFHTEGYVICAEVDQQHIANFDPARVLAECEAKRRIIEWHKNWPVLAETQPEFEDVDNSPAGVTLRVTKQIAWLTEQQYRETFGMEPPTGPVLRLLALPYADRPGYQERWRT